VPNKLPQDLLDAFQSNNLIPVIGAGVSMSLTDEEGKRIFPSWGELLSHAADEIMDYGEVKLANGIRAMLDLGDFQQAAKYARQGLQGTRWSKFFRAHFEVPLSRISEGSKTLPKAIWGLGNRVLTLNYDKVLRGTCPDIGCLIELDNDNKAELADFKRGTLQAPAIWHFHGRVDNISTVIFTAESYDTLYAETNENYKAALEVFRGLCRDQRLLFVGCSLEDAELLHEMVTQHQLFDGNTGPHYALVCQNQYDAIKSKVDGLPVELLTFEAFGDPLVKLVNSIAIHVPLQQGAGQVPVHQQADQQTPQVREGGKKIALLTASPLNEEQHYSRLIKEFKKIACPIDHFNLCIDNLNNLQGYDYLLILSKVIKDKLLIENDHLCRRLISFEELEEEIGNERTAGVFIFVDQLPDSASTVKLHLPTLILADLEKKHLDSAVFQLFKKNNLDYFENSQLLNRTAFELCPLTEKIKGDYNIRHQTTPLPDSIDPKTVRNFVGRTGDLEQICRKLMALKEDGEVLTVKGSGGIGKTTTVKKVAVALAERGYFEGGINFVDCEPITDSQQFRYKVAAAFNLEQAEDLRQHLRDHHDQQSRLILIDNFETLLYLDDHQEIKAVLGLICDYATIVITSRERLQIEGEVVYEMRQFTTDEAVELFVAGLDYPIISTDDMTLLRQEILENLLDNNPLAIRLITGNMPKGKSFNALKEELESNLFSKISDSELEVFDNSSDLNIARKKSIYGSIRYSYNHLLDNEQRAFELLSLFPDGIEMETFKRVTHDQINTKNSNNSELQQMMITDHVIKALENKSMIENNSGQIKLQSIVGKFAEAQLRRRDNIAHYYRNAFIYNRTFASALINLKGVNERRALMIFNSHQGNYLKSISYCNKFDFDSAELIDYLEDLSVLFIEICSLGGWIRELSMLVDYFHGKDRQCADAQLLLVRYFDGDFDSAFTGIKQLIPLEKIATLDRTIHSDLSLAETAFNIYLMEGEVLYATKYYASHKRRWASYPDPLFFLGEYNQQLAESCKNDFFTLELQSNMDLSALEAIDAYLSGLYDKAHLERMQVSYIRSKLVPLQRQEIEVLVTVNPYTRGLKELMLAFVEPDAIKKSELYQDAIAHLGHIKYYYVEALYFFAKFLQTHNPAKFDSYYRQGLDLAQNYHYRFLQFCFEQLLHPTSMDYDSRNYPLPDNENFTDYIQFLIKDNKHRKDN
jgi:SIR2-like domain/NB-ARC domain